MSLFGKLGSIPKYRTMSGNVRRLQETLNLHLNEHEKSIFIDALNEYHTYRDVAMFVKAINTILDTPPKRQLLSLIRKVIPQSDIDVFDQCARGGKVYGSLPRYASKGIVLNPVYMPDVIIPSSAIIPGKSSRSSKSSYSHTGDRRGKGERSYNHHRDFRRGSKDVYQRLESRSLREGSIFGDNKSIQDITVHRRRGGEVCTTKEGFVNFEPLKANKVERIYIGQQAHPDDGFGFSIRGGSEYGLGIYVSSVDENGPGYRQGLHQGDLILEVNDISFEKITHDEGAKIIRSARKLDLVICRIGRIPGSYIIHQMYKWVDAYNRPVSPPPELEQIGGGEINSVGRRSGLMLLKESDERKVNVVVDDSASLGLMIRGGREFGLGIYISGVDPHSVAENAGMKVGDQILDINGESFIDISHPAAVRVLKVSKHMVMTIKDIGKLPYARTTIDTTEWLSTDQLPKSRTNSRYTESTSSIENNSIGFTKGAGSQLMLNSLARIKWDMIEEQAHQLLNEKEQGTLRYYLSEYQKGFIRVDGLVMALFELLNTHAKFTLMSEIRNLVSPRELDKFDALVLRKEVDSLRATQSQLLMPETYSDYSFNKSGRSLSGNQTKSYTNGFSEDTDMYGRSRSRSRKHRHRRLTKSEDNLDALHKIIDQIPGADSDESDSLDEFDNGHHRLNPPLIQITGTTPVHTAHHHLPPESHEVSAIIDTVEPRPGPSYLVDGRSSPKPIYHVPGDDSKYYRSLSSSRTFDPGFHEFANGLNNTQSSPRPMHRSMTQLSHWRDPSHDRSSRTNSLTPSYDRSRRNLHSLQNDSYSQKSTAFTSREHDSTQKTTVAVAEIHPTRQVLNAQNSLSTSDESGVDLNGMNSNRDPRLYQQRVTISSKDPVDIDDALAGRFDKSKYPFGTDKRRKGRHQRKISSSYGNMNRINAARKKYGDIPLDIVHIKKKKTTLGMAIEGGANTRQPLPKVINLQPGGAAAESGKLKSGHVILEVNGISLCGLQHTEAAKMIAEAFKNKGVDKMELLVTEPTVDFEAL